MQNWVYAIHIVVEYLLLVGIELIYRLVPDPLESSNLPPLCIVLRA